MTTPCPGRRKIESVEDHWASKHGFFAHFSAPPCPYKKLLQIRSISGRFPTNIHEKIRYKSRFRLAVATHTVVTEQRTKIERGYLFLPGSSMGVLWKERNRLSPPLLPASLGGGAHTRVHVWTVHIQKIRRKETNKEKRDSRAVIRRKDSQMCDLEEGLPAALGRRKKTPISKDSDK
jgi:hypothetical protein